MEKFSFFRIFYGKKLYGKLFSVPVNCKSRSLEFKNCKFYKLWISEINQIQGLVICQCGLLIQSQSCCTQTAQEALFVRDFPINYEKFCRHPILGARVK